MKAVTNPNEWIDRYVNAVGRLMPAKQRADVEQEIRSLIGDELDAALPPDRSPDEETVFGVLRRFGKPEEIAARYRPPAYLIGPALYPTYRTVLGVVLGVVAAVTLFGAALAVGTSSAGWDPLGILGNLFSGLMQVFAWVTIVFALIDYFQRREASFKASVEAVTGAGAAWDVQSLPPVQDDDRAKVGELAGTIIGATIGIFVFNSLLHDGVPYRTSADGEWQTLQLLTPEFWRYVPWLTALWLLEIALSAYVLARGRWSNMTRWLEVVLNVLSIAVTFIILTGGPIAANPALESAFKIVVALSFAIQCVEVVRQLYRLVVRGQGRAAQETPGGSLR
jgi:hypothetical protein